MGCPMKKAIVSLSGGMDSATLLANALYDRDVVAAIGFRYGSKHNEYELRAASQIALDYSVPFDDINIGVVLNRFKSNLLKGQGEIPEGHYEAASMSQTVVPARNIIFAAILAGEAWSRGADEIWIGVHAGDHAIYPDCRPEFIRALNQAIMAGTDHKVTVCAPFLYDTKADILRKGLEQKVPYHLTRTCYKDTPIACGKCGSCQERLAAFAQQGTEDPIPYQSRTIFPKE